jgi:hypothetical protein
MLAIGLVACASPSSHRTTQAGSAPKGTLIKTFRAYDSAGQLTVAVSHTTVGVCWTSSIAVPIPGAYRCYAGNKILDPCFAPPMQLQPESLACVDDPWSEAILLKVHSPLPPVASLDGSRPWAVQLDNGARCVAATGIVPSVQGVDLAYRCANGKSAGLVDGAAAVMSAQYGAPAAKSLRTVTVTTIWRG